MGESPTAAGSDLRACEANDLTVRRKAKWRNERAVGHFRRYLSNEQAEDFRPCAENAERRRLTGAASATSPE